MGSVYFVCVCEFAYMHALLFYTEWVLGTFLHRMGTYGHMFAFLKLKNSFGGGWQALIIFKAGGKSYL